MTLEHDAELPLEGGGSKPAGKPSQTQIKLSRNDKKVGRRDASAALRGNRPPRAKKPAKAA